MTPMNRRHFMAGLGTAASATSGAMAATAKPNVLIILSDDQGYGDFSCLGNPVLKTPNLDKLHGESVRFTQFHVAPMCTPTRGELMTGVDALRNRATSVTAGRALLRRDLPTMANVFANNGYRTGIFGKWHLGDYYPYRPMDRGFHRAIYHLGWGLTSAPEFDTDYFNGRCHDQGKPTRFEGYCTDFWFSKAMGWMDEQRKTGSPFLCYLPTNAPHAPAWVDEKYSAPYSKDGLPAAFFGMIANLDENMGKLEKFLRETGLRENTIVVFMTDNGATLGRNVFNAGMRGFKTDIYEGGHRVPCWVRWPGGKLRKPEDDATPSQAQDVLPTVLDLCGIQKPASVTFDGISLAAHLRTPSAKASDRMMVVQYGQIPKMWDSSVIWNEWRLVKGTELFDLREDPAQKTNVSSRAPEVVSKMREHYERWWDSVGQGKADFQPISIGSDHQNPVLLTCSDWQDTYCDNHGHVSNAVGGPRGGAWRIFVEKSGEYQILLSRWPPWQNLLLTSARAAQKMTQGSLLPGKAMPIAGASIQVAGQKASTKTGPGDHEASFRIKLTAGSTTDLQAWFQDASGADICGAFYATVRRV